VLDNTSLAALPERRKLTARNWFEKGLRRASKAQWLKPEIRVRAQHLKTKGTLRQTTVKVLLDD